MNAPETAAAEAGRVLDRARMRWHERASVRGVAMAIALLGVLWVVPYPLYVTADCVVIPAQRAHVRSLVEGVLAEITVDEGSQVKAGEIIARLDDAVWRAERDKAVAEVARVEAELARLKRGTRTEEIERQRIIAASRREALKFAERELERARGGAAEGVVAREQVEIAERERAVREKDEAAAGAELRLLLAGARPEDVAAAEADLRRARANLDYLQETLAERLVVRAPIDGVVITPRLRERIHERVEAGGLICELADTRTVQAEIFVPERDLDALAEGMPVAARVEGYPLRTFEGKVMFLGSRVEHRETATHIRVVTELQNADGLLKQGMTGYGEVNCGPRPVLELMTRRFLRWIRLRWMV